LLEKLIISNKITLELCNIDNKLIFAEIKTNLYKFNALAGKKTLLNIYVEP